ncbi:MAG: type II toxin-antitoxin system HipA family toxin [Hydrogenophaga sp.]|uniref:type II toxin-antitoxin system HipA family toxin n=1 Tax=Hydrogenophaga sp. TaxID=1904254 RepID=UPI0016B27AD7|nr:type II toxin-antitoxin system HipA family toxin [Hydrogenophaga sp.]NIM40284.1 type II toxin-antitoxin system HipA family toxin [Hydrogenophaga sp.]NIN25515.1 type II toxin-antitoxin system HipA family toxin [Hydrogenophaga sp.]NIN30167.1 type II toxin-antitoxin system HipA family toxin [Hydrogenophaga sp.]NIN54468.1 type II toxin-antitoxin system HipA family toxin [Hydrogenophaga sp.]NIO50341.1 type II toxin-antitoxin system HipA family toxin [Hydrogenophaga sp.]
MAAEHTVPVWAWLPGRDEPVLAAELSTDGQLGGRLSYAPAYVADAGAYAFDPVALPLRHKARGIRFTGVGGLPGALQDACPSGYGADLLQADHGRPLSALEMLELGAGDTIGALEVCLDIERKRAFRSPELSELAALVHELDEGQSPSRAIRRLLGDGATSAGGDRPKATITSEGRLWLAKMQDRSDTPFLPAKEFVVMRLAADSGITVPEVRLETLASHHVYLIERFDRLGDPRAPQRRPFVSAHTALRLSPASTTGDPARSYLVLADMLRRWGAANPALDADLAELWRRMAFNALVGNADDHPRNHGFYRLDGTWRLSPAFDVTPLSTYRGVLRLAVGADGSAEATAGRLLQSAPHFGVAPADAAGWLHGTAARVHDRWADELARLGAPAEVVAGLRPAFALSADLAEGRVDAGALADALQAAQKSRVRRGLPVGRP